MISFPELLIFTWAVLCIFAVMDQLTTYRAVKFTTEALGKKQSESRESNMLQRFLWKHFNYEISAMLGLLIQWTFYSIVIFIFSFTKNDFLILASLVLITMIESSIVTSNFLYYRRCRNLKRKYPKDYKKLIKDLT
jgi:hypothetical protein